MPSNSKNGLVHRPTTWKIEPDSFGENFDDGSAMLQITSTKNGHQFNVTTEINREDLVHLRQTIDEYLSK